MLLEAMLAGLPVVATRVSAVPEIVADGETGLLVAARRRRGGRGGVCRVCSRRPAARRALGEAGRRRAHDEFSVARMTERTIAVYERRCMR